MVVEVLMWFLADSFLCGCLRYDALNTTAEIRRSQMASGRSQPKPAAVWRSVIVVSLSDGSLASHGSLEW